MGGVGGLGQQRGVERNSSKSLSERSYGLRFRESLTAALSSRSAVEVWYRAFGSWRIQHISGEAISSGRCRSGRSCLQAPWERTEHLEEIASPGDVPMLLEALIIFADGGGLVLLGKVPVSASAVGAGGLSSLMFLFP